MTWKQQYKKEREKRFANSCFSRVRGRTNAPIYIVIRKTGNFAKSDIFLKCKFCNGLTIKGVCQKCGMIRVCMWCMGVIQPNGHAVNFVYTNSKKNRQITHGLCKDCKTKQLEEIYNV
jgi:hypothetical protein